jgi:hypothetical protein
MRSMMMPLTVALALVSACSDDEPQASSGSAGSGAGAGASSAGGAGGAGNGTGTGGVPSDWTSCTTADDCTLLELGCCDHCNGGELLSVNKAHADEALAALKESPCTNVQCTERGCALEVATCTGGVCGHQPVPQGECPRGTLTPAGKLCVRGTPSAGGEELTEGGTLVFQVYPTGCLSSSCTTVFSNFCEAGGPGLDTYVVETTFCIAGNGGMNCTPDCNGGGFVECPPFAALAGNFTVEVEGLSLEFTVPSTLPFGGSCVGMPF